MQITLTVEHRHLDKAIDLAYKTVEPITERCPLAICAKERFGSAFQTMGYTVLRLAGQSYTCPEAEDFTRLAGTENLRGEGQKELLAMLPKTFVFNECGPA